MDINGKGKSMKRKIYIALWAVLTCCFSSCDDWLDVRSDLEDKEEDIFRSYEGFKSALTGCYMAMADRDVYGERLTMTNIESLANLWQFGQNASESVMADHYLNLHDYDNDYAKTAVQAIYTGLFNVVSQANIVLKHCDTDKDVFASEKTREMFMGEAYALRAYCQMDVLRLFGQLPQGANRQVELPYSYTTQLDEVPAYYSFTEYVTRLEEDLDKAAALLKEGDPSYEATFEQVNSDNSLSDEFLLDRQFRMNYWAVRAMQARLALYLGKTEDAYKLAMEIINLKIDGETRFPLTGASDLSKSNNYYACPSEALLLLSKFDLKDYTVSTLVGASADNSFYSPTRYYILSIDKFNDLYNGMLTASHNRYRSVWNKSLRENTGATYCAVMKYYYEDDAKNLMRKHQVIPLIRMSEIYLIAMETTTSLEEANRLYRVYMRDREVLLEADAFASLDEVRTEMINEYRREFFAEGLMFYVYKRNHSATMMWKDGTVQEDEYIVKLPASEYNPNLNKE